MARLRTSPDKAARAGRPRRFHSIRQKLLFANAAILLLVMLSQTIIFLLVSNRQVADSVRINSELVDALGQSADQIYETTVQQINMVTMNEDLQDLLLVEQSTSTENHLVSREIRNLVNDRYLSIDTADTIFLRDRYGNQRLAWRRTNLPEYLYWQPDYDDIEFVGSGKVLAAMQEGKLLFTRRILSLLDYSYVGDLVLTYNMDRLEDTVSGLNFDPGRELSIYDASGDLIVSTAPDGQETSLETARAAPDAGQARPNLLTVSDELIVSTYDSDITGWTMVSAIRYSAVTGTTRSTFISLLSGTAVIAVIGFFLILAVARKITGPLEHMVQVSETEDSHYSQRYSVRTGDELEQLGDTLNELMERTDNLVNQVLRDELKYRDAQLQALQAQINPHMLNNTLECINQLAAMGRNDDVRRVTLSFSNLMDALGSKERIVTVREELATVNDFVAIYQILLQDKLAFEVEAAPETLEALVPRLSIQPLVENAVIHGIKGSADGGLIQLTTAVSADGERLAVTVSDDGKGMPDSVAAAINSYAEQPAAAGDAAAGTDDSGMIGTGLRNVIDRLQLTYGGQQHLDVISGEGSGSIFTLTVPLKRGESVVEVADG